MNRIAREKKGITAAKGYRAGAGPGRKGEEVGRGRNWPTDWSCLCFYPKKIKAREEKEKNKRKEKIKT